MIDFVCFQVKEEERRLGASSFYWGRRPLAVGLYWDGRRGRRPSQGGGAGHWERRPFTGSVGLWPSVFIGMDGGTPTFPERGRRPSQSEGAGHWERRPLAVGLYWDGRRDADLPRARTPTLPERGRRPSQRCHPYLLNSSISSSWERASGASATFRRAACSKSGRAAA